MTNTKYLVKGGVNPPDDRAISRAVAIMNAAVPSVAVIPLLQHAGRPARCVVKPGDAVREGMLIGAADGQYSANVHSSIPGRVREVRRATPHDGKAAEAVVIELGGEFEKSGRHQGIRAWDSLPREELLSKVRSGGVVGMGGHLVPTHLKLADRPGVKASLLMANGVGSEPSLSADFALMREKPREIAEGMRICRAIADCGRLVLAVGEDAEDLVPGFERAFRDLEMECKIVVLSSRYPQGNEQLIVASIEGAAAPVAASAATVVLNVGTLLAVYEAVVLDRPFIERVLTVTGSSVREPRNLKVRLGTRIGDLFDDCGGLTAAAGKIVIGGPMRGVAVDTLDVPVTKGTAGVMVFSGAGARTPAQWPCIRCGSCVEACPWDLVPTRLYKLITRGDLATARKDGLARCTECGCCAYACPSHIPLSAVLRSGKQELKRESDG
jgi:Na+-translocating ferredoxin:NAD+ oxidoreductase subunit C